MKSGMIDFTYPGNIVDLVLGLVLIAGIVYLSFKLKFNYLVKLFLYICLGSLFASWFFGLNLVREIVFILLIGFVFVLCLSYTGAIRSLFAKFDKKAVSRKHAPDKIVDRQIVYDEIYKAVSDCSQKKVGAIITFERHDDLKGLMKNGTIIKAPVTAEILETIFYPGTRLHDGAVIIKENMIYAASVYYTPTSKPLTGKYGSRHRAAIGISEISDSVTVVVSEETGRISIAQDGEINPVNIDEFMNALNDAISRGEN